MKKFNLPFSLIVASLLFCLFSGCGSEGSYSLSTKGKTVHVKVKTTSGSSQSGYQASSVELREGWAVVNMVNGQVLVVPSESVMDIIIR